MSEALDQKSSNSKDDLAALGSEADGIFGSKREPWAWAPYLEQRHRTQKLYAELKALGLTEHIADLALQGYTVVPPGKMAPPEYIEQLRAAVLNESEARSGIKPDIETGSTHAGGAHPLGQFMRYVLFDDPIFEPMLTNPVLLGLVNYLIGEASILSLYDAMVKGPGDVSLPIHNDHGDKHTPVYPMLSNAATINFTLSDYDAGSGPIAFLPGSHNFKREPLPAEMQGMEQEMVPVYAPAGSAIIWSADTWHMAIPRRDPGLRITLLFHFCRSHMKSQADFSKVDDATLARNPPRFRQLMDVDSVFPFDTNDIDGDKVTLTSKRYSLFDCHPMWKDFY